MLVGIPLVLTFVFVTTPSACLFVSKMATSTITDDELRNQLLDLGETIGPVTPSTRPLLLRKLKRLQKEGSSKAKLSKKDTRRVSAPARRKSPSRKLIGFSSDEEPDVSSSRPKRRVSRGRAVVPKKEEEDISRDDIDASRDDSERLQDRSGSQRGNSTVHSFSFSEGSNSQDQFSDSDSNSYTGPFQRGSFRFRSFRRKKDSHESPGQVSSPISQVTRGDDLSFSSDKTGSGRDTTDGSYKRRTSFSSFLNACIYFVVLICVVLLAAFYLELLPPDRNRFISKHSEFLPFCQGDLKNEKCQDKDVIINMYVDDLVDLLSKKAGQFECGNDSLSSRNISRAELAKKLQEKMKNDFPKWPRDRLSEIQGHVMDVLCKDLPDEFGIRLYNRDSELIEKCNDTHWLESIKPSKTVVCRIQQSFYKVVYGMLAIACVLLVFLAIYYGVRNHWRKEEEDTRFMYKLVENIIDILRKHHDSCKTDKDLPPYLPIPHVRDMLIKPAERNAKASIWNRAVRFLSANESRIRVESQRIAGEDFEVWRWIHITSPKGHKVTLQESKRPKCWQGQAFENFQWAVNPPIISPTPCLKIRNMFDPDVEMEDNWHVIIQDALLEKCHETGANIVHIAVDKSSSEGCVYVKCDSHNSAGMAFKDLHGSWFDGRLVAVKYLTLRRYHQRFPKALSATGSLQPSGTSPSSLVTLDPDEDVNANDSETEM